MIYVLHTFLAIAGVVAALVFLYLAGRMFGAGMYRSISRWVQNKTEKG